jgi:WD40 repeat protein
MVVPKSAVKPAIARRLPNGLVVFSAAISPDCTRAVISCYGNDAVTVWDLDKGVEIRRFEAESGGHLANEVALSPDKRIIATAPRLVIGQTPCAIRLWDAESGRLLKRLPAENGVFSLAFTPNSRRLISGMADSTVLLWEVPQK